ncbi:hypothetical protein GJ496_004328 [Pomphorhynchus laevis]|nr:hypothetical protein GJ496_004328 [Pomphorhynchus laevis]
MIFTIQVKKLWEQCSNLFLLLLFVLTCIIGYMFFLNEPQDTSEDDDTQQSKLKQLNKRCRQSKLNEENSKSEILTTSDHDVTSNEVNQIQLLHEHEKNDIIKPLGLNGPDHSVNSESITLLSNLKKEDNTLDVKDKHQLNSSESEEIRNHKIIETNKVRKTYDANDNISHLLVADKLTAKYECDSSSLAGILSKPTESDDIISETNANFKHPRSVDNNRTKSQQDYCISKDIHAKKLEPMVLENKIVADQEPYEDQTSDVSSKPISNRSSTISGLPQLSSQSVDKKDTLCDRSSLSSEYIHNIEKYKMNEAIRELSENISSLLGDNKVKKSEILEQDAAIQLAKNQRMSYTEISLSRDKNNSALKDKRYRSSVDAAIFDKSPFETSEDQCLEMRRRKLSRWEANYPTVDVNIKNTDNQRRQTCSDNSIRTCLKKSNDAKGDIFSNSLPIDIENIELEDWPERDIFFKTLNSARSSISSSSRSIYNISSRENVNKNSFELLTVDESSDAQIEPLELHKKVKQLYSGCIKDRFDNLDDLSVAIREAGLVHRRVIIGIDYTLSNIETGRKTFGGKCLHTIDENILNPYQEVIRILCNTLYDFDDDNMICAFGFGDSWSLDKYVFRLNPASLFCKGFDGVMDAYNLITPNVKLGGPTNFAPLIRESIKIVQTSQTYTILIIIADGQVVEEDDTVSAIVEASFYPISIILVGVGDGPWDKMKEFDDSLPQRKFDNFQFVNYHEVLKLSMMVPRRAETSADYIFALMALMEIPDQYQIIKELGYLDNETLVRAAIFSFPSTSASGCLGLRPEHLQDLLTSDLSGSFLQRITSLVNTLLDGGGHESVARYLCGANLIALVKEPDGVRPIAHMSTDIDNNSA